MSKKREYLSPLRQQQAEQTRQRIAEAAYGLLTEAGYAGMTVEAVARRVGVSPQTVYAIFGSKRGILAALLDRAAFGPKFAALVTEAMKTEDPVERLRFAPAIARQIYEAQKDFSELLRGGGVVAPELAAVERDQECRRREAQAPLIAQLAQEGRLKPGLAAEAAQDVLWTLTGRDIYRMLVQERGWSSDQYESWLRETLLTALLG